MSNDGAIIGVWDHAGWAVMVTVAGDGKPIDSRRVELVDEDLPSMPHHHQAQRLPLEKALELVERVRVSADGHATLGLDEIANTLAAPIRGIAMRECPRLPPTVAERIQSYWAQTRADTVMYRKALADAAESRGWSVHWYDPRKVIDEACNALEVEDLESRFAEARKSFGPPWNKDHRLAMAAAIVGARR